MDSRSPYVSTTGAAAPAARVDSALFVATAFSITALPTLGRILLELSLARSKVGVMAILSTVITTPALRRYLSRAGPLPLGASSPHTIR